MTTTEYRDRFLAVVGLMMVLGVAVGCGFLGCGGRTIQQADVSLQATNHTALVQEVKDEVLAAGIDLGHGPGECGRFEVTARVAWALRAEGAGLMAKFGGQNGCAAGYASTAEPKFGVDVVAYQDGTFADILTGGGDGNTPAWNVGTYDSALWRAPHDPGPPYVGGAPEPPPPTPTDTLEKRVDFLEAVASQQQGQIDDLSHESDAQQSQITAQRNQIVDLYSHVGALEARQIPVSCTVRAAGFALSCRLGY